MTPEPWTLRLLARWLWRGWTFGFGRESGQTPTLRRAIRAVNPVHRNPNRASAEYEAVAALLSNVPDRDIPQPELQDFKTNSRRSRLILLALALLRPRHLDGQLIDLAKELQEHGVDAVTEFVRGHRTHAAARGFWPARDLDSLTSAPPDVLKSHAIDEEAAADLRRGDVDEFLARRGAQLAKLAHEFVGAKVERGALVRPSLRELSLAGAAVEDLS